ncbi:hypothetical protein DFJ77DRAFT_476207 [Powellomyces hirtus]|nr:hypothetical protein DFJ77DRAFT_476207 [Powellomyces hirtus]
MATVAPQQPDAAAADLKALVSDFLRKRGVLGSLKAQLRSSVFAILKSPDEAGTLKLPFENPRVTALRATKEGRQSLLLVRDLLKTLGLEYTLAVFEPEVHLDNDDPDDADDILQSLNLAAAATSDSTTSSNSIPKPLLVRLVERHNHPQQHHKPALSAPLAPLHKPTHPPPPVPAPATTRASSSPQPGTVSSSSSATPSGPPPTKELPTPPPAPPAHTDPKPPQPPTTTQWPSLTPTPTPTPTTTPKPTHPEREYEDDEDDFEQKDVDELLGGGDDDEEDEEDKEDHVRDEMMSEDANAAKHPGPQSADDNNDDDDNDNDEMGLIRPLSPHLLNDGNDNNDDEHDDDNDNDLELVTSDRSVSPDFGGHHTAYDHQEDADIDPHVDDDDESL